jgi:hypothetical protein
MKRVIYQVAVGKKSKLYEYCIASVADYCKAHGIEHVVQRTPILMIKPDPFTSGRSRESWEKHGGFLPIFEKENAFSYLRSNDQVAIIDADVWIRPGAPNIFDEMHEKFDFAGVVEREMPITDQYRSKIFNYSRMQYGHLHSNAMDFKPNQMGFEFINMGVMVMNKKIDNYLRGDTPQAFLRRPEFKDFVDGKGPWKWSTDQTLLNYWIKKEKMKVKNLDWKWNALYKGVHDYKVKEAHFVHFFLKDLLPNKGEDVDQLITDVS